MQSPDDRFDHAGEDDHADDRRPGDEHDEHERGTDRRELHRCASLCFPYMGVMSSCVVPRAVKAAPGLFSAMSGSLSSLGPVVLASVQPGVIVPIPGRAFPAAGAAGTVGDGADHVGCQLGRVDT